MAEVVIYTKPFCPYCARAEALLRNKGVEYTEIVASMDMEKKREMMERSGRTTFPQIFIGGTHVGGFDDLNALERAGKLDALLAG